MVEKPKPEEAPSRLAVIGRYILMPEVFAILDAQEPGAGGEIQLTDAMAQADRPAAVPRLPLRGPALRLRRQAGLPRGDRGAGAASGPDLQPTASRRCCAATATDAVATCDR